MNLNDMNFFKNFPNILILCLFILFCFGNFITGKSGDVTFTNRLIDNCTESNTSINSTNNNNISMYAENITIIIEASDDTYVSITSRTTNYGNEGNLLVNSNQTRTILQFENIRSSIFQMIPPISAILEAKVRLFIRGQLFIPSSAGWNDSRLSIHLLEDSFCQYKANWNCRDYDETGCCVQWRLNPLPTLVKPDYKFTPTDIVELTSYAYGWIEFDVLPDLLNLLQNSFHNSIDWLVKKYCESDYGTIAFWSCESGRCPELVINLGVPCPVPTLDHCNGTENF